MFLIDLLIILTTLWLILFSIYPKKLLRVLLLIFFSLLFILQISTTRLATVFEYSGLEKAVIQNRSNYTALIVRYIDPPQFYRFRDYLFSSINFVNIPFALFLIIGLYSYVKYPKNLITTLLIITLFVLMLISPNGKYGPILLQPFIYFLMVYGLRLAKK